MKKEYNFKGGRRGAVTLAEGKERITIRLDKDVLDSFRELADREGRGGYQTLINEVLRAYLVVDKKTSDEERIRQVVRDEIHKAMSSVGREQLPYVGESETYYGNFDAGNLLSNFEECVKNIVHDAIKKSDFDKWVEMSGIIEESIAPRQKIISSFANWAIEKCKASNDDSIATQAFAEYVQSETAVADIFDEKTFSRLELKSLYEPKETQTQVRQLTLRPFLNLLKNAAEVRSKNSP